MTTIATSGPGADSSLASLRNVGAALGSVSTVDATDTDTTASSSATTVDFSALARTLMQAFASQDSAANGQTGKLQLPRNFDEMVKQRTESFTASLVAALGAEGVTFDQALTFQIDRSGTIRVDGPYKDKIEKYFKDNPEAAKEFKAIADLNAMKATEEALRLYNEEQKAAHSKAERSAAFDRYTFRLTNIQALAYTFTLKDGTLTSAAVAYADSLSGPSGRVNAAPSRSVNVTA